MNICIIFLIYYHNVFIVNFFHSICRHVHCPCYLYRVHVFGMRQSLFCAIGIIAMSSNQGNEHNMLRRNFFRAARLRFYTLINACLASLLYWQFLPHSTMSNCSVSQSALRPEVLIRHEEVY